MELASTAQQASDAVNPQINAVIETWPAEDTPAPGSTPLAGVPFLLKDLAVDMAGKRMELGSRLAEGNVAEADSSLMKRFRRAGLVTLGRTTTPEFAYSTTTEGVLYGTTRNPWDPSRTPGGSSGGSGAAVAAGIVPIAHATDAAGSIRIPAATDGLFGLKPTRGRITMGPDADEVFNGHAVHGALSRSVRDSATLLDLVQGPETGDPYFAQQPERPYVQEVTRSPGSSHYGASLEDRGPHRAIAGRSRDCPIRDQRTGPDLSPHGSSSPKPLPPTSSGPCEIVKPPRYVELSAEGEPSRGSAPQRVAAGRRSTSTTGPSGV